MAEDHLLLVKSTCIAEQYKRFYFRDIQAFIIREKSFSFNRNMVDGILWLLLAGIFLYLLRSPLTFALGAIVLLYKRFSGPYCACHIQTAVQTVSLPSLYRLRTAEQVLSELAPLIEAAQSPTVEESQPSEPPAQVS
jgi:hypothetical protein